MRRSTAQLAFLLEADKLKSIERMTKFDRRLAAGEHRRAFVASGAARVRSPGHADEPVDLLRVITLVVLHDLIEIDAGDTFAYDETGYETKAARETAAADRLYGILPDGQGATLRAAWEEFEHGDTPEARFARAIDRLQPVLLNHAQGGGPWREHGITVDRVLARNAPIGDGSTVLWTEVRRRIDELEQDGRFP